jgi:integrase
MTTTREIHLAALTDGYHRKITKRTVEGLLPGQAIWDGQMAGFGVRRQRRDAVFVLKFSSAGRQRFYTIGRHGALTVEMARIEARRLLGLVASGVDPSMRETLQAPAISVAQLCQVYLAEGPAHKPDKKASSWYADASNINRHILPLLGKIQASMLEERQVIEFVSLVVGGATRIDERMGPRRRAIVRGGKAVAGRALAVLAAVYAFGMRRGFVSSNPTKTVKAPKGNAPGRFLSREEWARLGDAMAAYDAGSGVSPFINAVHLLALTGCRRSEITRLRWSEVDLERKLLHLENSKAGPRTVPLGDDAAELIERMVRTNSLWVFPSPRGNGPIVGIQKVWNDLRREAGLATTRLHDLRHSFASQAVAGGASLYLTGAILGHRQPSTTQRYAHLQADPIRHIATNVSTGISRAMNLHRTRALTETL